MNFGNSSNCVQALNAFSTGTATSVQRWIGRRRVLPPLCPPPPPPPSSFEAALPASPARPPVSCFFAPSAPLRPSSSASSPASELSDFIRSGPFLTANPATAAAAAVAAAGSRTSLPFKAERSDWPFWLPTSDSASSITSPTFSSGMLEDPPFFCSRWRWIPSTLFPKRVSSTRGVASPRPPRQSAATRTRGRRTNAGSAAWRPPFGDRQRTLSLRHRNGRCVDSLAPIAAVGSMFQPRQPLEPARQVPVPVAEQLHRRRQ